MSAGTATDAKGAKAQSDSARNRYAELKRILEERRKEILNEVQVKMRDVRAEGAKGEGFGVLDAAEDTVAVHEVQRLQHVGRIVAFALAGLGTLRLAEQAEEDAGDVAVGGLGGAAVGKIRPSQLP